jgi:hypothetical protein
LCAPRVERFKDGSEIRYFVLDGQVCAPSSETVPRIVYDAAERIDHPFFSVDVAINESGKHRVVEIGDGQGSDLVGWTVEVFVSMWRHRLTPH